MLGSSFLTDLAEHCRRRADNGEGENEVEVRAASHPTGT
jgi:hypothetical protein